MGYVCVLNIMLESKDTISTKFSSTSLKMLNGMKSGKIAKVIIPGDKGGTFLVKPYYRRFIGDELHIFAVQVPYSENRIKEGK